MDPYTSEAAKRGLGPEVESSPVGQTLTRREIQLRQLDEQIHRDWAQIQKARERIAEAGRKLASKSQKLQKKEGDLSKGPRYLRDGAQYSKAYAANGHIDVLNSEEKASSSPNENATAETVRLATFRRCTCQVFTDSTLGKTHLSIKITAAELCKESGVAISYTWGQFDRTKHCIGHLVSHPTENVWIELGAEWRVDAVLERLVQFTDKFGACWIDQVCLPRRNEQIRQSLTQIPAIFRILPVIVLCPSSLCACLRKAYQAVLKKVPIGSSATESAMYETATEIAVFHALHAYVCLNSNGACSWPYRIWTNQEFRYARSVTLVYAEVQVAECCFYWSPLPTRLEKMNDYSRLSHQRYKDQLGLSDSDALDRVKEDHASFVDAFGRQDEFFERTDMQVAAFLLGATLVTADKHMAWYPWASLTDEITSVMDLKLSASQPKDYVLSLFADWDFYDPPSGFQDLPTNMLLKDFLRQLRKVEPVLIPTRCPAGLFGISDETWGFDASDITLFRPIEDVRHIYGMFQWYDAVASSTPGRLPLRLSRSRWQSCASKARSLASWLAHHDKVTGFVWFCNALLASQRACTNRLAELGQSVPSTAKLQAMLSSDDPLEQVQGCRGCLVLVANHISSSTDDAKAVDVFLDVAPRERLSGLAQNCLHRIVERASAAGSPLGPLMLHCYSMPLHGLEDAVFEVICEMLFLDAKLCWERGVRVILGEWHPLEDQGDSPDPRWAPGLATSENKTVSNDDPAGGHEDSDDARDGPAQQSSTEAGSKTCIGLVHWETFCQARAQQKDTMTIALGSRPDIPFYEAFRSSSPGCLDTPPEYKVFGVWVPLDHERFGVADIGAIVVDEDKANAFVV